VLPHITKEYTTEKGVPLKLHENKFFAMYFNGFYHYLEAVKYGRGVVMVPRFNNGDLLLVCLRRAPAIGFSIEFPRGGVDPDEALEVAAQREVAEETGYAVPLTSVHFLGRMAADSATINGLSDAYRVDIPDTVIQGAFDAEEIERPIRVSESQFKEMVRSGEITCGLTLAAYALMLLHA